MKLLNLYRRWATAKTSKGCGIVEFGDQASAAAAMAALSGSHTFDGHPGYEGPMVVEAMDVNRLSAAGKGERRVTQPADRTAPLTSMPLVAPGTFR